jgi:hypothetical protein
MNEQTVLKLLAAIEEYANASAEVASCYSSDYTDSEDSQKATDQYEAAEAALIEAVTVSTGWKPTLHPAAVVKTGPKSTSWSSPYWTVEH